MTHTIEKYGDIGNFSGVTYVILPFINLKFVGTWAPTTLRETAPSHAGPSNDTSKTIESFV